MHKIKYSRYPNNEIRATHYYSSDSRITPEDSSCESEECPNSPCVALAEPETQEAVSPTLDISSDFRKSGFGKTPRRTKFGSTAKNTLLRAGGALDTLQSKPYHYVMFTGTLPGGTPAAMQAMMDWSSWITESCTHWLTNNTSAEYYFYVWELQDRGALHIHLCCYLPDTYERCWTLYNWWDKWLDVLQGLSVRSGCDVWERKDGSHHHRGTWVLQADAQQVYSSVAAYLSGYCGGSKDKHKRDAVCPYYPTRWWGYSRALSKLLKELTETYVVEHTNYRDASYQMALHYEQMVHDTPKVHRYNHKVGIGSTVVSYHPENKGTKSWHPSKNPMYNQRVNPNTAYLIRYLIQTLPTALSYLKVWGNTSQPVSKRLLVASEDLISCGSLRRFTLNNKDIALIRDISCALNSLREASPPLAKMQMQLQNLSLWSLSQPLTPPCDVYGWWLNTEDLTYTVDTILGLRDTGTSDGESQSDTVSAGEPAYEQIPLLPQQFR